MHTDTSDHPSKAQPGAMPARPATRHRHPTTGRATSTAPGSTMPPSRAHATPPARDPATAGYTFRTWNRLHTRNRRSHFLIAIAVSVAAHLGLALSGEGDKKAEVARAPKAAIVEVVAFDMPEPEETPVEIEDAAEPADTSPAEFAPPMQADLPSLVSVDSFVQPLQPPLPSGISTDVTMLAVPTTTVVGTGGGAPRLFEIAELDRAPNRIRTGMLNFPQELRRLRKEGDVHLLVVIDPTGRVRVARVLASTHPEFTRAAITAAEQSVYEAPRKGGVAVSAQYSLRVPFRLSSDS